MKKDKSQPGVMIYFSDFDCVSDMCDEKIGKLFRSVIEYARSGTLADFGEDESMNMAWKFFKSKVEVDFGRYIQKKEARLYANKVKFIKYHAEYGLDPNNPRDIDRIQQDEKGRFIVLDEPPERPVETTENLPMTRNELRRKLMNYR